MSAAPNDRRERRSPRLAVYDYRRAGWYFVTVCTKGRVLLFGDVVDGAMRLNEVGRIAEKAWINTATLRPYVVSDAFVVMPNHVHLLFGLAENEGGGGNDRGDRIERRDIMHGVPTPPAGKTSPTSELPSADGGRRRFGQHVVGSVSSLVGAYKSAVTRAVNRCGGREGGTIWQGRFHDRIVRNEGERERIRRYIEENPLRWHLDPYKP